MFVLVEDTTRTVSLCGLNPDQVTFLQCTLIKTRFEWKTPECQKLADELLAGVVTGEEGLAIREEEGG